MKLISFLAFLFIPILLSAQKQTKMTIHFDSDKASIRPADAKQLDSLVAIFTANSKNISIEIYGHCDSRGTNGYNDTLALKRVRAAKKYLLAKGVELSSIKKDEGYGETMPLFDVRLVSQHWENRRVELIITEGKITSAENTITEIIADTATKSGTNIILKDLNFQGGTHHLLNSSLPTLRDLLIALQKNENLVIQIEGHICCIGDASDGYDYETHTYNLSEERAKTVYTFLLKNNINRERLSFKGYGHQQPIYPYPERSEQERIMNRRVEIKIVRK